MLNASFKSPLGLGGGMCMHPLPQTAMVSTSDMNNVTLCPLCNGLSTIHMTSQRTGNNETKAYPTIRICLLITLTGDCLSLNARKSYAKCLYGEKSQVFTDKRDDAEYRVWQRSSHSSPRWLMTITWRRGTVTAF